MPPRGRPRRQTKKVDYSKFTDPTANDGSDSDKDVVMDDLPNGDDPNDDADDDLILSEEDREDKLEEEVTPDLVEENVDEELAEETPAKKKRGRKPKAKVVTPKEPKTPKKEIKQAKQLTSLRDRLVRVFGSNKDKLIDIIQTRREWEKWLFQVDTAILKPVQIQLEENELPYIELNPLTEHQLNLKFLLSDAFKNFQFGINEIKKLAIGERTSFEDTTVLNTGGLITDLLWLTRPSNSRNQILSVALSNIVDDSIAPEFSLLKKSSFPNIIQFYSFSPETNELQLIKTLLHNWGTSWDLKQAPIVSQSTNDIFISANFNDGSVRVLRIDLADGIEFLEITKPSLELSIPGFCLSSYDWLEGKIIAGTNTGHVAEFFIDSSDTTPSFLYPLHSDYIFSIAASKSPTDDPLLYSSSADGSFALFSTVDLQASINRTPKSKAVCKTVVYSPKAYSFIHLDGPFEVKAVPPKAIFAVTPLVKHDGSTESLGVSGLHPLLLSGGSDGRIKVHNVTRKLFNSQKYLSQGHQTLKIQELQYSATENTFRLVKPLEVETLGTVDNSTANVYPSNISINAIKWNENLNSAGWYAAGTTGGFIILQNLAA